MLAELKFCMTTWFFYVPPSPTCGQMWFFDQPPLPSRSSTWFKDGPSSMLRKNPEEGGQSKLWFIKGQIVNIKIKNEMWVWCTCLSQRSTFI